MSLEQTFHRLKVAEVRRETEDAVSIRFETPPDLTEAYRFEAGQYLTLRRIMAGEDVRRNYSVCVAPSDGELRVAVKQIEGGLFSTWVNTALKAGEEIEVMAPQGRFTWAFKPQQKRRYLAVAGGSGITPVLSLLKTGLAQEPGSRFTLFYGNRSTASIIFLEELAALKNRYLERLEVFHFLEDEEDDVTLFNGRLDEERCGEAIDHLVVTADLDAVFICGPGPMMTAAAAALQARGVASKQVQIERFTTEALSEERRAATAALARRAAGAQISVVLDGRRARVDFDPARGSMLENVRAAGLPAPFACKGGVCATCRAKVESGKVEMRANYALSPEEVAQGFVLTCQAIPTTDEVTLSYDV